MTYQINKFEKFVTLLEQHTPEEGANYSSLESFGTYKATTTHGRRTAIDLAAVWIIGGGKKVCYVGDQQYDYSAGNAVVMFYPLAVETEIVEASPEMPFLIAGVAIEMGRIADVLLRIDRIDGAAARPVSNDPSGIFSIPLNDHLLDSFIRLFELLANPLDAAILGDSIVDEIYYRLLTGERGGELRFLLQQRGEIQRISKAVDYIHSNLHEPISVEQLADMVYMSRTSFYENFRNVMHVSPLQYAKSVKLHKAQSLIQEGKNNGEAGYMVGYNSPAQFSREYKRHFGYSPSATTGTSTRPGA
jgi:AraC-like DNA-binding protein